MVVREDEVDVQAHKDISFVTLLTLLLRARWLLVLLPLALFVVIVLMSLRHPHTFTSIASFVTQRSQSQGLGGFAGVAAQLGVAVPNESPTESPAFYAQLIRSAPILEPLVRTRFRYKENGRVVDKELVRILTNEETSSAAAIDMASRQMSSRIVVDRNRETGIVTLRVRMESPELSFQVARRIIELLDSFNSTRRRTQATAEREFVQQRLTAARKELNQSEATLQEFLRRNRQFEKSPDLQFGYERLQREVTIRQAVYTSLAQGYEQARIEEVRNLPVITVVQKPSVPVTPDGRGTVRKGFVALVVGFVLAFLIALARGLFRGAQDFGDESRLYADVRREALADLKNPVRGFTRLFARRRLETS